MFGRSTLEIAHSLIQDRTTLHVVKLYNQDTETCRMHDVDKIGASGIGDLVRSKNKRPVNPFPEVQKLVSKIHNIVNFFSYGERWEKLLETWKNIHGGEIPTVRVALDLEPSEEKMHDREWDTATEVGVSLYLTKPIAKLVQTE